MKVSKEIFYFILKTEALVLNIQAHLVSSARVEHNYLFLMKRLAQR